VEDQTNANTEELDTQSSEQPAISSPDAETDETAKKSARTLKLKAAEAGDNAGSEEPVSTANGESEAASEANATGDEEGQQGRSRRGRQRRPRRDPNTPSANPMSLTELKNKATQDLIDMAREMGIENMARSRRQDIIFALLKRHAKSGEDIWGDGVLEILQDGFGFLRSADSSFLAGPDDIYVSPSQIRRFNLRTGDTVTGMIRPPKD
jgi:transcription termination factor Rho